MQEGLCVCSITASSRPSSEDEAPWVISLTCVPDHMDGRGGGNGVQPVFSSQKAGGGGQLPSAQPHCSSDDGRLDTHESRGFHLLCSTRRTQGIKVKGHVDGWLVLSSPRPRAPSLASPRAPS